MEQLPSADLLLFTKYYRAKKTTVEMAKDRGFNVDSDKNILGMSLQEFIEDSIKRTGKFTLIRSFLDREYTNAKGELLLIKFEETSDTTKQGVDFAKDFIKRMNDTVGKKRTGINVINQPLSHDAKQLLNKKYEFMIQIFQLSDLQFNPTQHMFSGLKYESFTPKEQREFLTREKIKIKQLPQMSIEDPIVRYFGWRVGQVIKKRISLMTNESLSEESVEFAMVDSTPF